MQTGIADTDSAKNGIVSPRPITCSLLARSNVLNKCRLGFLLYCCAI